MHRAHANAAINEPSSLAPVPANVESVIMRALDKSPTKRFLTVRQFVDEVSRIARGDTSDPKQTQPMGKVGKAKAELVQTLIGMRNPNWQPGAAAVGIAAAAPVSPSAAASPSPASTVAGVHPPRPSLRAAMAHPRGRHSRRCARRDGAAR